MALKIRRIPYPYRAMLAICSDLDETPSQEAYFEIIKYLNSTELTFMGRGLGLESGNSIYFDMPKNQFSYWNADETGRGKIRTLIKSGHIDCLHSYGDLANTRAHAERALTELDKYDCKLKVWVDHGTAPSNFGPDIMRGKGDIQASRVYHADITTSYGIKYVWLGRVTSITGQDVNHLFKSILNKKHPAKSSVTFMKELLKVALAKAGNKKYSMHRNNKVMEEKTLRSGQRVYEFIRSNPHWEGVSHGDRPDGLPDVLNESVLSRLVEREGVCILYTHLGKCDRKKIFNNETIKVLSALCEYVSEKKILVTTTRRLLDYCTAIRDMKVKTGITGERCRIEIDCDKKMDGVSLYVEDPERTDILLNGRRVNDLSFNAMDHVDKRSISFKWNNLQYPLGLI